MKPAITIFLTDESNFIMTHDGKKTQLLINKRSIVLLIHCCVCTPLSLSTYYSQLDVSN